MKTKITKRSCPVCKYTHIYEENFDLVKHGFVGQISPTLTCVSGNHIRGNRYFTLIRPTPNEPAYFMVCPICQKRIPVKSNTKISEKNYN